MNDGIVNIKGKDYETVASRVQRFRKEHPDWTLESRIVSADSEQIVIEARISDESGRLIANGHAEETRSSSYINKTSALENAETSAWGRALSNLGFGGSQIASADEVKSAIKAQSAPPRLSKINAHQNKILQEEINRRDFDIKKMFEYFKIKQLHELPANQFEIVFTALKKKPLKEEKKTIEDKVAEESAKTSTDEAKEKLTDFVEKHRK